jgi:TRAP-type C4-dicarboxylate transport system substrate-binding protein
MRSSLSLRAAGLGLVLCLAPAGCWAKVTLIVSTWVPPTHTLSQSAAKWCEDVTQATASRVTCNILPRAVASPPATFDSIRDGVADGSFALPGYTPGRLVLTQIAELPFAGESTEVTSVAYQHIHERYLAARGEYSGVKVLSAFPHGPGGIYNTKRPVQSLQDLQALKSLVDEVRKRTAPLEEKWIAEAKAAGLADPAQVLKAFPSEVSKAN